jgi:hypothetical protein
MVMNRVARLILASAPLIVSVAAAACSGGGGPGGPPNGAGGDDGSSDGSSGTQAQFDACLAALGTAQEAQACVLFPDVVASAGAQRQFTAALASGAAQCATTSVDGAPDCYAKADCAALGSLAQTRAAAGLADPAGPTGDGTCKGVSW